MGPTPSHCPLCTITDRQVLHQSPAASAVLDKFPVSPGHTLVIPRVHVATLSDLPRLERLTLWELTDWVRAYLAKKYRPDGFNIGINDGIAAGQTVPHVHIHVIPRYDGDVSDPRGGVRWVIPDKARYWE